MAHVTKKRMPKPPAGYIGKRGAQRSMEEKVDDDSVIAVAKGKTIVERDNDLWIIVNGKPVHWSRWDRNIK